MPSGFDPTFELRDHFRKQRLAGDHHPTPEQLVDYHDDRLSGDEMEVVREHLATCPDCAVQLLALAEPLDGDDGTDDLSSEEVSAAWQSQRNRLFPAAAAGMQAPQPRFPALQRAWGTAAVLGMAAALLAVVVVRQGRDLARLREPQLNPPLVSLVPAGSSRQLAAPPELRFPEAAERGWVILNCQARLEEPAYDIQVVAEDGTEVHRFEGVPPSERSNFRLEIPRGLLEAGTYRLKIFTPRPVRLIDDFELRVSP